MKLLTVIGARPQFVKAAALSREIAKHANIEEVIIHTGQHFDENMSKIFFEQMEIPSPKYNLAINSLNHGAMTGRMMEEIEKILLIENPDFLVVYGDTNSTLAGALAAKKLNKKVVHIESGLRSFNNNMPEEINRILTDRISDYLFCPTQNAIFNLKNEGFEHFSSTIVNSGDIMLDAALFYAKKSANYSAILNNIKSDHFILCTLHRAENTDNKLILSEIVDALNEINQQTPIILPLHPRTKEKIRAYGLNLNVITIEPVGYFDMIEMLKHCKLVITDSGGLQKEAYFFGKNCLTLRNETEWTELVENKVNLLVGTSKEGILNGYEDVKNSISSFPENLYGKGNTSKIICDTLTKVFNA